MRYLVRARVRPGRIRALWNAIKNRTLGQGSVAGDEYLRNMENARVLDDGQVCWVEVCYCSTALLEERDYWEEYFRLERVKDAHNRRRCRDWNGTEAWSCSDCDCTARLEARMETWGRPFLPLLKQEAADTNL
ncbi:MAG: hypothetical protein EHM23_36590 [Acidobacteria bacterium]|nr:MAG: hypothetical protein EHM23_36590 [Acidobacteriota bacterium]